MSRYLLAMVILCIATSAQSQMNFDDNKVWSETDFSYRMPDGGEEDLTVYFFTSYSCEYCQSVDAFLSKIEESSDIVVERIHLRTYPFRDRQITPIHIGAFAESVRGMEAIVSNPDADLEAFLYDTYIPLRKEWIEKSTSPDLKDGTELVKEFQEKLTSAKKDVDAYLVSLGLDSETIDTTHNSFGVASRQKKYESVFQSNYAERGHDK